MHEYRDEQPQKVLQEQGQHPLQVIDFNNLEDLSAFGQRLAKLLQEQECHSLRGAEERYSLLTGFAVRYCTLLAKAKKLSRIISQSTRQYSFGYSYNGMQDLETGFRVEKAFLQQLMENKKNLVGGEAGIELSTVNYHGREFVIRGIFGGWYGSSFGNEGEVNAQSNHLSGAIHLYIYEKGEVVGKLKLQRWLSDGYGRVDLRLCVDGDLHFLNREQVPQIFDGSYISDYNKYDQLLGHFLHQLMIEIFQINGFQQLELQADNECDLITVANGCWPYGGENPELSHKMLTLLQEGKSLFHGRNGGSSTYYLYLNELDHPRVHFNGSVEPVSWSHLIEKSPIITKPELFRWPQFCGLALPNEMRNQQFSLAPVDLEAPVNSEEFVKLGRVGIKRLLLNSKHTDIQVCQTPVGKLSSSSVLERSMLLAQFDVLFNSKTKSIPEIMAIAVEFDSDGEFCRLLFNRILDTLMNQEQQPDEVAPFPNVKDSSINALIDLTNEFLAFEQKNTHSLAVKICKEELDKRIQEMQSNFFRCEL